MTDRLFTEQECRVLEQVMRYRRDVRGNRFTTEPVSDTAIDRILDPEEVKRLVSAPPECQLVAYLCVGYVSNFGDTPELEQIGWEARKRRNDVIHQDSFRLEDTHAERC